jgi:hypothetical protein
MARNLAAIVKVLSGIALAALLAGCGTASSPSGAAPHLPGTPGHYDDGEVAFDYPAGWPVDAGSYENGGVMKVLAVFGDGTWRAGCLPVSTGELPNCGPDGFQVTGAQMIVRVYRWWGAPAVPCRGDVQANATFGSNAVRTVSQGSTSSWEIRLPGNEFGQPNNIFVEAHTTSAAQFAAVESLVASVRMAPNDTGTSSCEGWTPSPSPAN